MKFIARLKSGEYAFDVNVDGDTRKLVRNGTVLQYDLVKLGNNRFSVIVDNKSYLFHLHTNEQETHLNLIGDTFSIIVEDERRQILRKLISTSKAVAGELDIRAPIPGLVVQIRTSVGERIKSGHGLVVLEAMKMENVIKAPHDGTVSSIEIQERQTVDKGQLLIRLKCDD